MHPTRNVYVHALYTVDPVLVNTSFFGAGRVVGSGYVGISGQMLTFPWFRPGMYRPSSFPANVV